MSTEIKQYVNKPRCTDACHPEPFTARDGREFQKCTVCFNLVFPQEDKKPEISPSIKKACLDAGHGEIEIRTCREGSANAGREYEVCLKCNDFVKFSDGKPSNKKKKRSIQESQDTDKLLGVLLNVEREVKKAKEEILAALKTK